MEKIMKLAALMREAKTLVEEINKEGEYDILSAESPDLKILNSEFKGGIKEVKQKGTACTDSRRYERKVVC